MGAHDRKTLSYVKERVMVKLEFLQYLEQHLFSFFDANKLILKPFLGSQEVSSVATFKWKTGGQRRGGIRIFDAEILVFILKKKKRNNEYLNFLKIFFLFEVRSFSHSKNKTQRNPFFPIAQGKEAFCKNPLIICNATFSLPFFFV